MPTAWTGAPATTDGVDICFILHEPQQPENVGAAARALATMGFADLRLVNSCLQHHHRARVLAHGCRDLLAAARTYPTLAEALADVDLAIATTVRRRQQRHYYHAPEDLPPLLAAKGASVRRCAIVFGREDSGLGNRELDLCHAVSTIPLAQAFPSLNLAQAVMLYAYSLRGVATAPDAGAGSPGELQALRDRLAGLLPRLGEDRDSATYAWALERLAVLHELDIRLLHRLCRRLEDELGGDSPSPRDAP